MSKKTICDFCHTEVADGDGGITVYDSVYANDDEDMCLTCYHLAKERSNELPVYAELIVAYEQLKVKHAKLEKDYRWLSDTHSTAIMKGLAWPRPNCDSSGGGVEEKIVF